MRTMMRIAAAMLVLVANSAYAANAAEFDLSWRYCDDTHTCDVIRDACYNWVAIGAHSKAKAQLFYQEQRKIVKCAEPLYLPQPKVKCNDLTHGCEVTY